MPGAVAKVYPCIASRTVGHGAALQGLNLFELASAEFNETRVMMTILDARTVQE